MVLKIYIIILRKFQTETTPAILRVCKEQNEASGTISTLTFLDCSSVLWTCILLTYFMNMLLWGRFFCITGKNWHKCMLHRAPYFSHAHNKLADPGRSVLRAAARFVSSSLATRSPTAARQSSTELSGLAGLNTNDVWRSNPVVEKAENT